jgi:Ca-activated chloride channel family protein
MLDIVSFFKDIEFAHKYFLWLLLLIPVLTVWYIMKRYRSQASFTVSTAVPFSDAVSTTRLRLRHVPFILRMLVFMLVVIALARPQTSVKQKQVHIEGIDIVLALDISYSMTAMDLKPNRLEACKAVIKSFIKSRTTDKIGLVVYSGEAYTRCPLTTDYHTLLTSLEGVKFGLIEDGTAIGDGLGTAINRLRNSEAKTKIIILLSDGMNNRGYVDPSSAAEMAKEFGIKVYTIGCGTVGEAPVSTPYGVIYSKVEIDEVLLKNIAALTGGKYYRAQNRQMLNNIYEEINRLEKSRITEIHFTNRPEAFFPFLLAAVILLALDTLLRYGRLWVKP